MHGDERLGEVDVLARLGGEEFLALLLDTYRDAEQQATEPPSQFEAPPARHRLPT